MALPNEREFFFFFFLRTCVTFLNLRFAISRSFRATSDAPPTERAQWLDGNSLGRACGPTFCTQPTAGNPAEAATERTLGPAKFH